MFNTVMLFMKETRMTSIDTPANLDGPLLYRICIQGVLDPSWSSRLEGLCIESVHCADGPPITTLTGSLQDQAALNGVLTTLYGLGFTLLSVSAS
jgi:hypothetical protein